MALLASWQPRVVTIPHAAILIAHTCVEIICDIASYTLIPMALCNSTNFPYSNSLRASAAFVDYFRCPDISSYTLFGDSLGYGATAFQITVSK